MKTNSKLILMIWTVLYGLFFINARSHAQRIVIVTSTDHFRTMSLEDVKRVYRNELSTWNGHHIYFLDHQSNTQIYKDFVSQYFGKTEQEMDQYWRQVRLATGKTPPKFLPEGFIPKALKSMKGSISYYYEGKVPEGLVVLEIK